ncbi:sensor histidine kinase [Bacillus massiliigorillae]|uniref:sensor histidine kinase n=1 Tax=Bacillus massiliigorillae TaxID=1243664 RepID=UPI0018A8089C|nr:histidine kinase [Bacillus massiliigorillae]
MLEYLRLVAFFFIWILFFIEQYAASQMVLFLFFCTGSVALFYLAKPLCYNMYVQYGHIVLLCLLLLFSHSEIVVFLLLYIQIDSIASLSMKKLQIQGIVIGVLLVAILWWQGLLTFALCLAISILLICSYFYKLLRDEQEEKSQLYEGLLREYRLLKRQAYKNEKVARLEERTRIAREIHDAVGHKLTSLLMLLKMSSMKGNTDDALIQLAEEALQETRKAVRTLQNDEHEGIASVLQLIRKLESESHIFVAFTTEKGVLSSNLSNNQSVHLYRILQEALTNAMKHAHSREVHVKLSKNAIGYIEFVVRNKVLEQKEIMYGYGLHNMQKRMDELGGDLAVYYEKDYFLVKGSFPEEGGNQNGARNGS